MSSHAGTRLHSGSLQQREQPQILPPLQTSPTLPTPHHMRAPSSILTTPPGPIVTQAMRLPSVSSPRSIYFEEPSGPSGIPFPTLAPPGPQRRFSSNSANAFTRPRMGTFGSQGSISFTRPRGKSWSEHTQDVAHQLAPPVIVPLVVMCLLWYTSSAVSNNLSKSILDRFEHPVSLTLIQFIYAAGFAAFFTHVAAKCPKLAESFPTNTFSLSGVQGPSETVLKATAPMAGFQLVGHLLSYSAMSAIPVSLVHAIKSLSPLFTVAATSTLFGQRYNIFTYGSMVPLTLGVIMTCSAEFRAQPLALLEALMATMIFVAQNLYSKQLLSAENASRKPAKVTVLGWCAALAFIANLPIWLLSDGWQFMTVGAKRNSSWFTLLVLFTTNGFSHFCQNLLSFLVLGAITPVAFSIASLLKRIVVITVAILWFGQRVSATQGWGILISFFGLYIYDRFGGKIEPAGLPH